MNPHTPGRRLSASGELKLAVVIAAMLLVGCRLWGEMHPGSDAGPRVRVSVSKDGFRWATREDQLLCAGERGYPEQVASVLHAALAEASPSGTGGRLSFRLFLLNDPVGGKAGVVSLVLLSPPPEESGPTLEALSGILSQARLPSLPLQRPRCTLEVSVTLPGEG